MADQKLIDEEGRYIDNSDTRKRIKKVAHKSN